MKGKKFERSSDTMAIVGFAENTRDKAPWNNPSIDLFGINEETVWTWFKQDPDKIKGWFQLHKRESFMRPDNHNDPNHVAWLQKKHTFPIFMQDRYEDIPNSVRFPIEDIRKEFGSYWRSTLAYIIAWAYIVGYKRIECYGFEMASDSEYWGQRANAAYIAGLARGKGLDVYVPPMCHLFSGIRYAYENNLVGARQDLETNLTRVNNDRNAILADAQSLQGEYLLLNELMKDYPELAAERDKVSEALKEKDNLLHQYKGRAEGVSMAIKMFDTFDVLEGESTNG
jgi:hypothetical protein